MATTTKAAAVSHVGKVRSNNQDSGFAGRQLFVVADGMGGHAGGDVASAIAVTRIRDIDGTQFATAADAETALRTALMAANSVIAETVYEHPELTGMGTTVSAILRVGDTVALAHIGDSRIYLWRDDELIQVTSDHTFVQRLVDSGRITPEEALTHPRRSVLMRVLGDVDAHPEVDTRLLDTRPGDRWLLCSDGLSSYVSEELITRTLAAGLDTYETAEQLVRLSLDHGAPDNVTVVLVDMHDGGVAGSPTLTVGSASAPIAFDSESGRRPVRLPNLLLHPLRVTGVRQTQFEPESDEYLEALIAEDRRRALRRKITWSVGIVIIAIAILIAVIFGYQWTQSRYYVGVTDGTVAIYRGVQQGIGPIPLSSVHEITDVQLDDLGAFYQGQVERTINADSLREAEEIVERLRTDADE
ncbi:Stp1/IreP family PP2C-type Ser/Thr phosphatase [Planctomonas deserti]|uniref:Stp1/IreP family PP2C-type Ser/Thr phosphatase n=1 Tax=Planctomonas deserti TaxID=2144185 RepID=UPI000D366782|nr:Stp1/IreP family PP2C-type Ser/Thr phosphatase [Planctomonas deserti]